jgi:hypothetical protein
MDPQADHVDHGRGGMYLLRAMAQSARVLYARSMPEGIPELLVVVATFLVFGLLVLAGILFQSASRSRLDFPFRPRKH